MTDSLAYSYLSSVETLIFIVFIIKIIPWNHVTVTSEDVVNACYLFFNDTSVDAFFSKYVDHISAPSMFY